MALAIRLTTQGLTLSEKERTRVEHQLQTLARHELADRPAPQAVVVLRQHAEQRRVEANVQVQLGPLGRHVVSHQAAETPDQAVRLAVADIERQLERLRASQAGEPTYGVPSRRLPRRLRPHPPTAAVETPSEPGET